MRFLIFSHIHNVRQHGGAAVSTDTSQQEGSGFEPISRLGPFCVEFAYSPCACMSSLRVLWHAGYAMNTLRDFQSC